MLTLNSLLIGSEDPEQLAAFYGEVLQSTPGWQEGGYTGYQAGNCYLMIGPHDQVHGKNTTPGRIIINFETADVKAEFVRIKGIEGSSVVREPYAPGDGGNMLLATLADPDGNYFQLATPMQ